jgi:hypothetical protein
MRRLALLGLLVLVSGCSDNSFTNFLGDTQGFNTDPNAPIGNSETMRRVRAEPVNVAPLAPEPGNVWPGPPAPVPTLADIEKSTSPLPLPQVPGEQPQPPARTAPYRTPGLPPGPAPGPVPPPMSSAPAPGTVVNTPKGPSSVTGGTSQYQTLGSPNGNNGVLIPNGNGTSTLIRPDGSVTTVPTPK